MKTHVPTELQIKRVLFCGGILITVFAWFLDNTVQFPLILRAFAHDYFTAATVLDELDVRKEAKVSVNRDGTHVLLNRWEPTIPAEIRESVTYIGRSTGIFNLETGIHMYELRLLTGKDGSQMFGHYIWNSADARESLERDLSSGLFRWQGFIFWSGIVLTATGFFWELHKEGKQARISPE